MSADHVWRIVPYPWDIVIGRTNAKRVISCDGWWREKARVCDERAGNYLCDRWLAIGGGR